MKSVRILQTFWQDTRHAVRVVRRSPVFTATAVLTMALAIGGNTAMFTVIRAVLLKPLEYRDPDRLVRMSGGATPARFAAMETDAPAIAELGAFTGTENLTVTGAGEPEVLKGVRVSASFLRILGVAPLLGRGFLPEEDSAAGAPVAMISAELWKRRFGGDPRIVGKTVAIGSAPCTVIGVLPPGFHFPSRGLDVWMTAPSQWPLIPPKQRALSPFLTVFGRLQPGVSLQQADAGMKVVRARYARSHPSMLDARSRTPREVTPLKDALVADVRSLLWMLFGAVGFVLLIACANVAGLLLARTASRSREFAVRAALGASRLRLAGQLLAESVLLSGAGGAAGLLLAVVILRAIPGMTAFELPRATEIHLDWAVLGFAVLLSAVTGLLFGLAPSLSASRPDLIDSLRASGATAGHAVPTRFLAGVNLRSVLSVGQIALSMVLLIGAALLMESVARLRGLDLGFNESNLLTMRVSLPPLRYNTDQKRTSFYTELVRRTASLPGARSAAAAMSLPMTAYPGTPVQDAAKPLLKLNERPIAKLLPVTPGYFGALQVALKRGREFSEHDTADAQRVAIIDENLARHFWPAYPAGPDPIGQRLLVGGVNPKPAEIVGIASNVRQGLEDVTWPDTVYVSLAQYPVPFAMLAVRTTGDPLGLAGAVRAQVQALDPDQAVADVQTMNDLVEAELGEKRLLMILSGLFAAVSLLLALIGIYGVISFSVALRRQELGIRKALGAQQSDILGLMIGQGLTLALAGIAIGLGGAFALTRLIKNLLFGVGATDPLTFAAIAVLFLLAALAASYIPARRAARVDPMSTLRVS